MANDPTDISGLAICYRHPGELKPHPHNAKLHSKQQVGLIARSISDFGFSVPVLIDEHDNVLAGHGRLLAAAQLGMAQVPTILLSHMSPAQKRAFIIADNRLAEVGGTIDRKLLALEHEAIKLLDPEFDLTSTGYDADEINLLSDSLMDVGEERSFEIDRSAPAIARIGDLWHLGRHRLFCGNALESASYRTLLGDEKAQMTIVDSPYNVRIGGHCVGKGKHREFVMASGEMTRTEFAEFLTQAFAQLIAFSQDGSMHFLFMDWRHMAEMVLATSQYTEQKNLIVWDKQSAGMGSCYRSQHELIWLMKNGTARHINNFGLGAKGRHRSNVLSYPGMSGASAERKELLALHPTVKPLQLISDAMLDCSKKDGLVLDCFSGSGTTIMAAERTGRRAAAIELDPHYIDVAIKRWQDDTGQQATLGDSGLTFNQLLRKGRSDAA